MKPSMTTHAIRCAAGFAALLLPASVTAQATAPWVSPPEVDGQPVYEAGFNTSATGVHQLSCLGGATSVNPDQDITVFVSIWVEGSLVASNSASGYSPSARAQGTIPYSETKRRIECYVEGGFVWASASGWILPTCPGGNEDHATLIVRDYVDRGVGWQPGCSELSSRPPSSTHYPVGRAREHNTWNTSNSFDVALLREWMVANVYCIVSNFGSVPTLNSGYRSPGDQIRITGSVGNWNNARHVHGDAADLDTPDGPAGVPAWEDLRHNAKFIGCGYGCVEPRYRTPYHFHVDYRGGCPPDW